MAAKKVVNTSKTTNRKSNISSKSVASDSKPVKTVNKSNKPAPSGNVPKDNKLSLKNTVDTEKRLSPPAKFKKNQINDVIHEAPKSAKDKNSNKSQKAQVKSGKITISTQEKKNNGAGKAGKFEAAEKIIMLKRKMHKDIFQRCLERKLLAGVDSWEESELNIVDATE
jgi:hypothetical protein